MQEREALSFMLCYFYRMKQRMIIYVGTLSLMMAGCHTHTETNSQDILLQAVTWYQQSAEMKAAYIQAYNWASFRLEQKIREPETLPRAVILDIDETVLDNSPQTARQILDHVSFSDEMWDSWCGLAVAEPLPGALEFARQAAERGVELYYISNRGIHLLQVTLDNLKSAGFPCADHEHLLLKTSSSGKDERRAEVRESHEVILLIGDNLGDFSGIFDQRQGGADVEHVMDLREHFGLEFIILPNPLYGSWEKPFRGPTSTESNRLKREALRAY